MLDMQTHSDTPRPSPISRPSSTRVGFTLVELMVVIMIIGIISGVVLTAMGSGDQSRKVDAGITRLDSLFSLARSAAITRQQTTRVIIHFDPSDEERFLRYATIVYPDGGDLDGDGNPKWKLSSEGVFLPGGVFFSPSLSSTPTNPLYTWGLPMDPATLAIGTPAGQNPVDAGSRTLSGDKDPLNLDAGPGLNTWISYEFRPNGTFRNPLSRVVLVSAIPLGNELLISTEGDADPIESAKGFVIFRSGKVLHFQSGEQILEGN